MWKSVDGISLWQGKYAVEILKRFDMMDCKDMATPMTSNLKLLSVSSSVSVDATMYRHMICSLMCLTNTRPDTCFVVNDLNQFLTDPRHAHLVAKHAVRYLKGTVEYGLRYDTNQKINPTVYVDSYWAGNTNTAEEKYVATCDLGGSIFLLKTTI